MWQSQMYLVGFIKDIGWVQMRFTMKMEERIVPIMSRRLESVQKLISRRIMQVIVS